MPATPDDGAGRLDVDAAFAEIVARWDDEAPLDRPAGHPDHRDHAADRGRPGAPAGDGPAAREAHERADGADPADGPLDPANPVDPVDGSATPAAHPEGRTVRPARPLPPAPREDVPQVPQREPAPRELHGQDAHDPLDAEERFVPAEPAPLPRDLVGWGAWAAVVGAPLFLLVVALARRDVSALVTLLTAAVFVAGFATLVVRLPGSRDEDDDDGAVV
ncbi:hypothetical protein [Kineococcus gypseus]|uniref:hypothetical protein n=1 Tax=Kineococcus gypseus TaxID=1637102 RepID=UPI003D7D8D6C